MYKLRTRLLQGVIESKVFYHRLEGKNSQKHLEESGAQRESSRLNMNCRQDLAMRRDREGEMKTKREVQEMPDREGRQERERRRDQIGKVIWEWEAGQREGLNWRSLGWGAEWEVWRATGPKGPGGSMCFGVRIGTHLSPSDNGAKMAPWVEGKGCQNSGQGPGRRVALALISRMNYFLTMQSKEIMFLLCSHLLIT